MTNATLLVKLDYAGKAASGKSSRGACLRFVTKGIAIASCLTLAALSARATTTYTWSNADGGLLSDAANWKIGDAPAPSCPTAADNLLFTEGDYTITLDGDASFDYLKVIAASRTDAKAKYVTFDLDGHSLTLTDATAKCNQIDVNQNLEPPAALANGYYDARLILSNGTVNATSPILLGNGAYNHRGYLKITDATYNGSISLGGSSLFVIENGGVWNAPATQTLGTEKSTFTRDCCTRMRIDGKGTKAIIDGNLWWNNTYDTMIVTNHAYLSCTTFVLKRSGGGGGSYAYAEVADHAVVTNTSNCNVGIQPGVAGGSYSELTISDRSSWYCGNAAQIGQSSSTGCLICVSGRSSFDTLTVSVGQGGTAVSNTFELVDSYCKIRSTGTQGILLAGNYNDATCQDNGIRISGTTARFDLEGGFRIYKDTGSYLAFEIPADGFADEDGVARVPFYSKAAFSHNAKTSGYVSSGATQLRIKANDWVRRHPGEQLTLMHFDTASKAALQELADGVVFEDLTGARLEKTTVSVSDDGKDLILTAAPACGLILLLK